MGNVSACRRIGVSAYRRVGVSAFAQRRVRLRPNRDFPRRPGLWRDPPGGNVSAFGVIDLHAMTHRIFGFMPKAGNAGSPGSDGASPYLAGPHPTSAAKSARFQKPDITG